MVQDNAATLEAESWILCERCGELIQGRDGHDLMARLGVHRHQRHDSSLPDTHVSLARMQ